MCTHGVDVTGGALCSPENFSRYQLIKFFPTLRGKLGAKCVGLLACNLSLIYIEPTVLG
jgi:hypothetical protein